MCKENQFFLVDRYAGTCSGPFINRRLVYILQFKMDGSVTGTCNDEGNSLLKVKIVACEVAVTGQTCSMQAQWQVENELVH